MSNKIVFELDPSKDQSLNDENILINPIHYSVCFAFLCN